jgi:hypothetical protein
LDPVPHADPYQSQQLGSGERERQQDTNTNTPSEQRHLPLSHLRLRRSSRLPTSPPPTLQHLSGSTWPVVLLHARRSYVGPSIIYMHVQQQHIASTIPIPIPSTPNPPFTSPPTASNSCIPSILLASVCLSPDLDPAPLC